MPLSPSSRLILGLSYASPLVPTACAEPQRMGYPVPEVRPEFIRGPLDPSPPEKRETQPDRGWKWMQARLSVSFPPPHQPKDTKLLLAAPWGSGPASHVENGSQCVLRESIIHRAPDYGCFFFPLQERIWIMSHRMK